MDFVLLPEIYYVVGTLYVRQEKYVQALEYFTKSSESKPDYWPPYLEAARLNVRLKRPEHAKEWLREGLRHSPKDARLLNELAAIGGGSHRHGDPSEDPAR